MNARPSVVKANPRAARWQRGMAIVTVAAPFAGVLAAIVEWWGRGVGPLQVGLLLGMYVLTILGIGVGFHRLITHRAFRTTRGLKVLFCVLGSMAAQGPVLFWAAVHRRHHAFADQPGDPHSPYTEHHTISLRQVWHAHVGWMFTPEVTSVAHFVPDLLSDTAVVAVSRYYGLCLLAGLVLPAAIGAAVTQSPRGALDGLLWGGLVLIVLVHHVSWSINSICHLFGSRPFANRDESTNNVWMSLLSFGEAWHNNHHAFPSSARHGLLWWQIDLSAMVIALLRRLHLAWDVWEPTPEMMQRSRRIAAGRSPV